MTVNHPDPEGHLTDITISAIRDLRDHLERYRRDDPPGPPNDFTLGYNQAMATAIFELDAILEPWGEGPTT